MEFKSINPYTGETIRTYTGISNETLDKKIEDSYTAFLKWRLTSIQERCELMKKAGQILKSEIETCAAMMTLEMGKPISEARAEINKCVWVCDYYAEHAEHFLAPEIIETEAWESYVRHDPMGTVLAIMPWNYPFWQVFRFAAPTLIAGNTALLKHAANVFGCAELIEGIFIKAGFPEAVFQNLIIHHDETERILAHEAVKAVSLTGSEKAGSAVAQIAGKYIKKSLLELGGNNAFIDCEDADLDLAVKTAVNARMLNCGQSCIAAKRFIIDEKVYDSFVERFSKAISALVSGNPMDENTKVGTLARKDLADQLQEQVQKTISEGGKLILGGKQDGCYHEPTILGDVQSGMTAFKEETFGPLAAMIKAKNLEHAIQLSEESKFGLGISIFTENAEQALSYVSQISDGAFFVNELVKSDPRLPFGGSKKSGYGRELSKDGIMEFVNRKTVFVK